MKPHLEKNSGDVKSHLEINLKFINSLGEAWITVQMIIQGSGKLSKMSLYELFNDLQAQESTVLTNSSRGGGPLALVSDDMVGAILTEGHTKKTSRSPTTLSIRRTQSNQRPQVRLLTKEKVLPKKMRSGAITVKG